MRERTQRDEAAQPELSIIIVTWNTRDLLMQCLQAIHDDIPSHQKMDAEVVVVDNASTDRSVEAVRQHFSQVRVIANQENVGFSRANNQGIFASRGKYVLLLNADTRVMPEALVRLVEFMEDHPDAGAVGARLLNADLSLQSSCSPLPTLGREFWYLLHLDALWPYAEYRMARWKADQARRVDVLLGACLLLRRSALDQVGLLDESFFMYSEEVDLCFRLHRCGWSVYWLPQAMVVHYGGQSTEQIAPEMFIQLYRSKVMYFRKHHGTFSAQVYKLILLLAAIPRVLLPIPRHLLPSARGHQYKSIGGSYRRLIGSLRRL